jgi:CheY-like chemotaxis protein
LPTGELRLEALPALTTVQRKEFAISDLKNLRILVVEDEPDALDLITMELTEHGARVYGATEAEEALALLEKGNFDLLISDIGLADVDGYALIRQIRGQSDDEGRSIPAIALTAYARTQDRIQAIAAGYNTHVAKPVEIHELVAVVKCLTGRLDKG